MFGTKHYVPILKWKLGEQRAIGDLDPGVKRCITPLIEVVQRDLDLETGEPTKALKKHIEDKVKGIAQVWGTERRFFLDPGLLAEEFDEQGRCGAELLFEEATAKGLQFIPVTGIGRPAREWEAVRRFLGRGLCLRVPAEDYVSDGFGDRVDTLMREAGLGHADIDVIIDLEDVGNDEGIARLAAPGLVLGFPDVSAWRTLTLASSAFPHTMSGYPSNATSYVKRVDLSVWRFSAERLTRLGARVPTFADYVIQHPRLVEYFDPRYMEPSATIRYTLDDRWALIRAAGVSKGFDQFHQLARTLVSSSDFFGSDHCQGCKMIADIAGRVSKPGSLTTWRQIGTCHHITLTVTQICGRTEP